MCLDTDACLTADPGVTSLIMAQTHNFMEIGHEIISRVNSPPLNADGWLSATSEVCAPSTG